MLLKLTFGYEIQEEGEDHFIQLQEHLMDHATELTAPGAFLVDVIPFCAYSSRYSEAPQDTTY